MAGGWDGPPGFHFGRQAGRPRGRSVVRLKQAALETIQMSVKPVHLKTVTSVGTAKEAWDGFKVMFQARENSQLLRLRDELSSLKKGGDENIIKFTSRAKIFQDELFMLGNPVDDNTLALRVWSGLPSEYGMHARSTFVWSAMQSEVIEGAHGYISRHSSLKNADCDLSRMQNEVERRHIGT